MDWVLIWRRIRALKQMAARGEATALQLRELEVLESQFTEAKARSLRFFSNEEKDNERKLLNRHR